MTQARPLSPTDVIALAPYAARSYHNEAWTRERVGASDVARPLAVAVEQLRAMSRGRGAWISLKHQQLRGLAGARRRGGNQAWEVDYLIDVAGDASLGLLERAVFDAGRAGAEKLFLRLDGNSSLLQEAREAGFLPYAEEVLYRGRAPAGEESAGSIVRPVLPADSYALYRLYNRATPERVRRCEAATFGEWHAARERQWLRDGVQLVSEGGGVLHAWAGAVRLSQCVALDLMLLPGAEDETIRLVAAAASWVGSPSSPVRVLLAGEQVGIAGRLEQAGFEPVQRFVCLMRRTAKPRALPKAIPAVANSVVGV